ncbi:alpha-N-acetylgalactosaminide alpha-2,6-sialyltransferase 2 [Cyprinodon tularosa]|uniref:alpha-N-acetylgalactosaminide alpha-2,6-sialyltransferase 2 n=1 Tax=Cyprinodon tularosa TaxID=77115 RepID=UPI0018E228ED|nr:alpha-N-acetylgalactosaminide alpha-2,6-sialyltransferase 2 [Cyprinodon tularosa]
MRASSKKSVFLLLAVFSLLVCFIFYRSFSSSQAAGGSTETPGEDQVRWEEPGAAQEEQQEETEAACSLRSTIRNEPFLWWRFNFSLPVLQWAGSLTPSSWKQLKRRPPPYGWKGLPAKVLRESLSLLKSRRLFEREPPGRCVRCAVVGNGGILRGSRQGKNIDGHDLVFRMNGAVIRGFEDDVGTKTSFYGFTTNTMKNALIWYRSDGFTRIPQSPEIRYIFIPSDIRDYVMMAAAVRGRSVASGRDQGDRPWEYFGHKPPGNFKMLHPQFISYVTHSFLMSPLMTNVHTRDLYMPSTGGLMLLTALHTCDQVSAYGFITRNYADFSDHYYDLVPRPLRFFANHDLQMEGSLWEELHNRKVLWLFQRD